MWFCFLVEELMLFSLQVMEGKLSRFTIQTRCSLDSHCISAILQEFSGVEEIIITRLNKDSATMISCIFPNHNRSRLSTVKNKIASLHSSFNHIFTAWDNSELVNAHYIPPTPANADDCYVHISYKNKEAILALESGQTGPVVIVASEDHHKQHSAMEQPPKEKKRKLTLNEEIRLLNAESKKKSDRMVEGMKEHWAKTRAYEAEEAEKRRLAAAAADASKEEKEKKNKIDLKTLWETDSHYMRARADYEKFKAAGNGDPIVKLLTNLQCSLSKRYKAAAMEIWRECSPWLKI